MKVAKGYYADGEDAYEMIKFFKPAPEESHMKTVVVPIVTSYPGAAYPTVTYEGVKKAHTVPTSSAADSHVQPKVEGQSEHKTEAKVEGKVEAKTEAPTEAKEKEREKEKGKAEGPEAKAEHEDKEGKEAKKKKKKHKKKK